MASFHSKQQQISEKPFIDIKKQFFLTKNSKKILIKVYIQEIIYYKKRWNSQEVILKHIAIYECGKNKSF